MKQQITAGETYSVRYPFVRAEFEMPPDDPEATQLATVQGWRPGVEFDNDDGYGEAGAAADGDGEMLLTVVSLHKPGRFPERVFYTRQWKDPDGRVFGRGALRTTTTGNFRKLLRGYRHHYEQPNEKGNLPAKA